jgi:hypothetical protein
MSFNFNRRLKRSLLVGVFLSILASFGILLMFSTAQKSPFFSNSGEIFESFSITGIFVEAYISAALTRNPHSGSTPFGLLLIAAPFNAIFYCTLTYVCMSVYARMRKNSGKKSVSEERLPVRTKTDEN